MHIILPIFIKWGDDLILWIPEVGCQIQSCCEIFAVYLRKNHEIISLRVINKTSSISKYKVEIELRGDRFSQSVIVAT